MKCTVYHGTTFSRGKQIVKDRAIKIASAENKRYHDTADGFIYVTKNLCDALDFSTRGIKGEDISYFVVFRIIIDDSELLEDEDEEKWVSTLTEDGAKYCYRISRNLHFGKDVNAVFCKHMPDFNKQGDFMQGIQYGDQKIKENEWKKLSNA